MQQLVQTKSVILHTSLCLFENQDIHCSSQIFSISILLPSSHADMHQGNESSGSSTIYVHLYMSVTSPWGGLWTPSHMLCHIYREDTNLSSITQLLPCTQLMTPVTKGHLFNVDRIIWQKRCLFQRGTVVMYTYRYEPLPGS